MPDWNRLKLQDFLAQNPRMMLAEFGKSRVVVEGGYDLNAQLDGYEIIQETYQLQITFPDSFPKEIPTVIDVENRIPRNMDHHTYKDGSFCLGSDIKLRSILHEYQSVPGFVEKILDPFLYSVSYKIRYGLYPLGELAHGLKGLFDDYKCLFNVADKRAVIEVLIALGKRKREANKIQCPCGCGTRIGLCDYRFNLQKWRQLGKRRWYRSHLSELILLRK